jgi:hypothetical protein
LKSLQPFLPLLFLALAAVFTGCETVAPHGEPLKTIDNPMRSDEYQGMADKYTMSGELWRGDPMAVCQIEIYKLEGKSAVMLDQKIVKEEDERTKLIVEVTTLKNIYWFHLEKPRYASPVWWIRRTEVFGLASDDPAKNPALKSSPSPVFREPTGISPAKQPGSENRDDPAPYP